MPSAKKFCHKAKCTIHYTNPILVRWENATVYAVNVIKTTSNLLK